MFCFILLLFISTFKGIFNLNRIKQDYLINVLIPCVTIIIKRKIIKREAIIDDFKHSIKESSLKFSNILSFSHEEKLKMSHFLSFLEEEKIIDIIELKEKM